MLNFGDVEALEMELPNLLKRTKSLMECLNAAVEHTEWLLGYLKEMNEGLEEEENE